MDKEEIIKETAAFVKKALQGAEGGHDWWHIQRVWKTASTIARNEVGVDSFVVELAALLHDIADAKFHDGNEEIGPEAARNFLNSLHVPSEIIFHVEQIIRNLSFKNSFNPSPFHSKELDIVQDADRLDAIGAVGIARAFNYGGFRNREMYNPDIPPDLNLTKEQYKSNTGPTLNHFYEKLLLLASRMNTHTGMTMALGRHQFMENFLSQFYAEWNGEK